MTSSADVAAPDMPPPPAALRERRWRRWCLALLVVVVPLTFAFQSRDNVSNFLMDEEALGRDVPLGGSAAYMEDEWKLDTYKVIAGKDPRIPMPADRALVLVRLAVDIRKDVDEGWIGCRLSLADMEGRRWLPLFLSIPSSLEKLIEPDGQTAPSCGSLSLGKPKAGTHALIEEKFLVPRQGLASMRPFFSSNGGRPRYLRFEVPASEAP